MIENSNLFKILIFEYYLLKVVFKSEVQMQLAFWRQRSFAYSDHLRIITSDI